MPVAVPLSNVTPGQTITSTLWNTYLVQNINKLLNQGHRVLTVAQFIALAGVEDGDEVYLEVDATNGIVWHLRYVAAEPTYFWRFLGGSPMTSEVTTQESTSSSAYAALTTAGPSIALPRAGDYDVTVGADEGVSSGQGGFMSYDIGGTGAVDADAARNGSASTVTVTRRRRKTAVATSTLTAKYKAAAATSAQISNRTMSITPVRITHLA